MAALVTIPGVELCRVGHWDASTGPWNCTAEQIAAAVEAQHDPTFGPSLLKLGHWGFAGEGESDADPSVGRIANLRASDDGQVLIGDLVGVPAPLAEIMSSAYPTRSVEAELGVTTNAGRTYAMVLTGLALLGETPPAIRSLADVYDLYGQDQQVTTWVAAKSVAATFTKGTTMPSPLDLETPAQRAARLQASRVKAGANITDLYDAFREWRSTEAAKEAGISASWSWIVDVYTDTIIVESEGEDYQLYRLTWAEDGGKFTFGGAERVVQSYEKAPEGSLLAASGRVPQGVVRAALEGKTDTTAPSATELMQPAVAPKQLLLSSDRGRGPDTDTLEQYMPDLASLRTRLGLPDDTSDDDVIAAADKAIEQATPTAPAAPAPESPAAPTEGVQVEDLVAARVAAANKPILDQLSTVTAELAAMRKAEALAARDGQITAAVKAGKIAPAQREMWEAQFDKDASVASQILASIAPGSAVPVSAAGVTGSEEATAEDAEYTALKSEMGW